MLGYSFPNDITLSVIMCYVPSIGVDDYTKDVFFQHITISWMIAGKEVVHIMGDVIAKISCKNYGYIYVLKNNVLINRFIGFLSEKNVFTK